VDNLTVCSAVQKIYENWNQIKDTVPDYGFKDYMKRVHGMEYFGRNIQTFSYKVVNEPKFMWFMLKYGNRNE